MVCGMTLSFCSSIEVVVRRLSSTSTVTCIAELEMFSTITNHNFTERSHLDKLLANFRM